MRDETVLLVDSDREWLTTLEATLRSHGYSLFIAEGAIQGKERAQEEQPDVIIVELEVPGNAGVRLVEQFRQIAPVADVVIVTESDDREQEEAARNAGAGAYYRKPIDAEALHSVIEAAAQADASGSLGFEADMSRALQDGEFMPYYQPKVCLDSGRCSGAEALLRWPRRDSVSVPRLIEVAERNGLITKIDEWMIRGVCRQLEHWDRVGTEDDDVPALSVNLSNYRLGHRDIATLFRETMRETGVRAPWIQVEITETVVVENREAERTLQELSNLGVGLSVDDFGTGYSALSYLKKLPLTRLKIDREFVAGLPESEEDVSLVRPMIDMAHGLGLDVLAEGVETMPQAQCLRELGCDRAQGFLFGRPTPAENFWEEWQTSGVRRDAEPSRPTGPFWPGSKLV